MIQATHIASDLTGRGRALAAALAGAWRRDPPPGDVSAALAPLLLATGAGGLAWWKARHSQARTATGRGLRAAFHRHALEAVLHGDLVQGLVLHFRDHGLEPILVKGWSSARLYPQSGLRPPGDVDICLPPSQLPHAQSLLRLPQQGSFWVDLHGDIPDLPDRTWDEVVARSRLARLGAVDVRILGAEDQLRQLCLHLLRHGAWRPLWLCDVAVALESASPEFDWRYCLSGDRRLTDWVLCTIGLAGRLLGARVPEAVSQRARRLPPWIADTVLAQWGSDHPGDTHNRDGKPMADYLRQPSGLVSALRGRWPNPVEAAFQFKASPFTGIPRLLYQVRASLTRAAHFAARFPAVVAGSGTPRN